MAVDPAVIYLPWDANLSIHWVHECEAEDRFEDVFFFFLTPSNFLGNNNTAVEAAIAKQHGE
jgi:hypothetical protein